MRSIDVVHFAFSAIVFAVICSSSTTFRLLGLVLSLFVYFACIQQWDYFEKNGVPFARGAPVFGTLWRMFCGRGSFTQSFIDLYNKFPNDKFFGIYELFGRPVYVIRDPELVKQVFIRDFDHFVNHRATVSTDVDAILGRTMLLTSDERWRIIRSTVSPVFTGSKMRLMLPLVSDCARSFGRQLRKQTNDQPTVFDMRKLFGHFACDAIASSSFGLEVNSLLDPDNDFYRQGIQASRFDGVQGLKFLGYSAIPQVMRFLRISFFNEEQIAYFRDLVLGNMRYRETNNIMRHDMINLLMQARKGKLKHVDNESESDHNIGYATVEESDVGKSSRVIQKWENDDLVAQSMIFILAGFTGISYVASYMAHELAVNPDVQDRLYQEIRNVSREFADRPITYDLLNSLKYLDMIVSETLRRWPIGGIQDRQVNKPYDLINGDGSKVRLNKGDGLWITISGFHLDPKYFPDPLRFDPERFSEANKDKIVSGTYLPFGAGPRNCIGSRFALMELKALFVHLLMEFSLHKCEKTMDPIVFKHNTNIMMEPRDGFWLELRPRQ